MNRFEGYSIQWLSKLFVLFSFTWLITSSSVSFPPPCFWICLAKLFSVIGFVLLIILNKLHHLNLLFRLFIRENHTNQLLKTAKLPSQPPSNGLAEVIHGGFALDKFKLESLRRILYFSSYVKEATYRSHVG